MKKTWLAACLALGLALGVMAPVPVRADGVALQMSFGADNQAHFDVRANQQFYRRYPWVRKAARNLIQAKRILWKARPHHPRAKAHAIEAINAALDQLNWILHH